MKNNLIKKLRKNWLKTSLVLGGLSLVFAGFYSGTLQPAQQKTITNSNRQLQDDATTTAASSTFLTKNNTDYEVLSNNNGFVSYKNNVVTNYSLNGFVVFQISLPTDQQILSIKSFNISSNQYLGILSNKRVFYVYEVANPNKPVRSFELTTEYNKVAYSANRLYLFDDQTRVSSSNNTFFNINLFNMTGTTGHFDNVFNGKFVLKIIQANSTINAVVFGSSQNTALNKINDDFTFNEINLYFSDLNLAPISMLNTGGSSSSPSTYDLANPVKYIDLRINNYYAGDLVGLNAWGVGIGFANYIIMFRVNDLNNPVVQKISFLGESSGTNHNLSSIIFKPNYATFILENNDNVYNLNYGSQEFFITNTVSEIIDPSNAVANTSVVKNYSLIGLSGDNYILAGNDDDFFGVSSNSVVRLADKILFQVFAKGVYYGINTDNVIPITVMQLNQTILIPTTARNESINSLSTYVVNDNLNFLRINPNTDDNKSGATIVVPIAGSAWFDNNVPIFANLVIEMNNFMSMRTFLQTNWMSASDLRSKIDANVTQLTTELLNTEIQPLQVSELNNNYFKINSVQYTIENINVEQNSFQANALITYNNLTTNTTKTMSLSFNYALSNQSSNVVIFRVFGQTNNNKNEIKINDAVLASRGIIPFNSSNYLPSYLTRISLPNESNLNLIQRFYNNFIEQRNNINVSFFVSPDDVNGTLTITYIFDRNFNNNGNAVTWTYTGFKKYSDFHVGLKGDQLAKNTFDYPTISDLTPKQQAWTVYEISTGESINNLLATSATLSHEPTPEHKPEVDNFLRFLSDSNLGLMNLNPEVENLSAKTPETLLEAMYKGEILIKETYSGVGRHLADLLGLDADYSIIFTLKNINQPSEIFNMRIDPSKERSLIDNFNSNIKIVGNFKENLREIIETHGFNMENVDVHYKWINGDDLEIVLIPKTSFLSEHNLIPERYSFIISWSAKNAYDKMIYGLQVGVPTAGSAIILGLIIFYFYYRKIYLRKFY